MICASEPARNYVMNFEHRIIPATSSMRLFVNDPALLILADPISLQDVPARQAPEMCSEPTEIAPLFGRAVGVPCNGLDQRFFFPPWSCIVTERDTGLCAMFMPEFAEKRH